jgi:hypothetical protein
VWNLESIFAVPIDLTNNTGAYLAISSDSVTKLCIQKRKGKEKKENNFVQK